MEGYVEEIANITNVMQMKYTSIVRCNPRLSELKEKGMMTPFLCLVQSVGNTSINFICILCGESSFGSTVNWQCCENDSSFLILLRKSVIHDKKLTLTLKWISKTYIATFWEVQDANEEMTGNWKLKKTGFTNWGW